MKRRLQILGVLVLFPLLLVFTSCCSSGRARGIIGGTGTVRWTVMVFLNAANDLDEFSEMNVNQMEQVAGNPNVRIVVQWKRARPFAPQGSWTGTRRYLIKPDNDPNQIRSELVEDMGDGVDMGSPDTLREFIRWARANYPAERYVLVIWNHGSGWRSRAALGRGVSFDDQLGTYIRIWDLPTAIRPTSNDPMMDVLLFDASLMQMLEVAYECRNVARIIVGSEESPPGEGYPYHEILAPIVADSDMAPVEWARQIPDRFVAWYAANYPFYTNITQSAVDTSKLDAVASALDLFAESLINKRTLYLNALQNARQNAQSYSSYPEYRDLWHAVDLIKLYTNDPELIQRGNALQSALQQAIIANNHGNNNRVRYSYGLSIYFPSAGEYLGRYNNTALSRATRWDEWLQVAP
ncbi:MAG: hypothetical protein K6U12_05995 [Armatimonadetes bacterium]|nr:hypothetical protein [Armatimonadota bacterium]CUU34810.1 hypothetical protein DCOP10_11133 [Armatimonadetes bacterium DC]